MLRHFAFLLAIFMLLGSAAEPREQSKQEFSECGRPCLAVRAQRLCPEGIFVPPDFPRYRAVSKNVHEIFKRHTDLIEPMIVSFPLLSRG